MCHYFHYIGQYGILKYSAKSIVLAALHLVEMDTDRQALDSAPDPDSPYDGNQTRIHNIVQRIKTEDYCSILFCMRKISEIVSSLFLWNDLPSKQGCGSGSGIRCLFDLWIRDPGWVKNQEPDPDHISESLETIFELKYFNSLMQIRDPESEMAKFGSGMKKIHIRDKHSQHCVLSTEIRTNLFLFSLFVDITVPVACLTLTKIVFDRKLHCCIGSSALLRPAYCPGICLQAHPEVHTQSWSAGTGAYSLTELYYLILRIRFKPITFAIFLSIFYRKRRSWLLLHLFSGIWKHRAADR